MSKKASMLEAESLPRDVCACCAHMLPLDNHAFGITKAKMSSNSVDDRTESNRPLYFRMRRARHSAVLGNNNLLHSFYTRSAELRTARQVWNAKLDGAYWR